MESGSQLGDDGAKAIGKALKINNSLTNLIIECLLWKVNPFYKEWFKKKLLLAGNGIGDKGAKVLFEGLKTNTTLVKLSVFSDKIFSIK